MDDVQKELEGVEQIDVRTVVIFWGDDDPRPNITFHNCSCFEALGLAETAVTRLKEVCQKSMDIPQEPDLDDGDDDEWNF